MIALQLALLLLLQLGVAQQNCTVNNADGRCIDQTFCTGTVTGGQCPGLPAAVKCCTGEVPVPAHADIDPFIPELARQWSLKRSGTPPADWLSDWLKRDLSLVLAGRRARGGHPDDTYVGRAWLIARQEQMWFESSNPGQWLSNFDPPAGLTLNPSTVISGADQSAPVADLLVSWANEIRNHYTRTLSLGTYAHHGGGSFRDAGLSVDIFLGDQDDLYFFAHQNAVDFLKAAHETCKVVKCDWRILYNDFTVADEINRFYGFKHVVFIGSPAVHGGVATNIVFHGPDPLILHLHLDIIPKAAGPSETTAITPANIADNTRTVPLPPLPAVPCTASGTTGVCKKVSACQGTKTPRLCLTMPVDYQCCTNEPAQFVEHSAKARASRKSNQRSRPKPSALDPVATK